MYLIKARSTSCSLCFYFHSSLPLAPGDNIQWGNNFLTVIFCCEVSDNA